jgi:hypothetical protein
MGVRAMTDDLGPLYGLITGRLLKGKVVPVLGAGVNLWKRPPPGFEPGKYLPSAQELANELARDLPNAEIDSRDLARVSQYMAALMGEGALGEKLHDVFDADYPPTHLHHFLAQLSRKTRESGLARECMLIVTTNYDDSLERAFSKEGEPYDLVTYIALGKDCGRFRHTRPDGSQTLIRRPNEYDGFQIHHRPVIAKLHGAVDRINGEGSFVITEDHYIDYIARATNLGKLLPITLRSKLKNSHMLFLGYSLRDWNLRVMLYRLWEEQGGRNFESWAIQVDPDQIDRKAWAKRGVEILPVRVETFVAEVEQRLATQYLVTP